jgi:hypothetical protein
VIKGQWALVKHSFASLMFCIFWSGISTSSDVTLIGYIHPNDGLGTIPLEFINCLKNDASIHFIPTRETLDVDLPDDIKKILNPPKSQAPAHHHSPVAIYQDILFMPKKPNYVTVPEKSLIKLAYSMFEASALPRQWVKVLNTQFDAVVVPDPWLVPVYKSSGVRIPIFVLPLCVSLGDFFAKAPKKHPHKPFIFGNMSALEKRKNHIKLIESFALVFGNNPDVKLLINARYLNDRVLNELKQYIRLKRLKNVEITVRDLTHQSYINFMSTLDCYVSLSKGEGFAIPPRQALALGLPVMLSDNTAHSTLCKSTFAVPVESKLPIPAYYALYNDKFGNFFDCKIEAAAQAMKMVYQRYDYFYKKAQQGKQWVKQYLPENLRPYYVTLVKPKKVVLGNRDALERDCIYTTSRSLYEKYLAVIKHHTA